MITSLHNPQVKHVVSLHSRKGREAAREFIVEGRRFLEEAIGRGASISRVFYCPQRRLPDWQPLLGALEVKGVPVEEIDEKILRKMCDTVQPQGILGLVRYPRYTWEDIHTGPNDVLLIADGVQDPGNLGTILRVALASGVNQVCLTKGTVDLFNSKVLRSTMGAIFSMVALVEQDQRAIVEFCQQYSLRLVIADLAGQSPYGSGILEPPLALVVGNEGGGASSVLKRAALQAVTLPMHNGVESLNVAMAAGILLYEIGRLRDLKDGDFL